jgi:hypothetical protein
VRPFAPESRLTVHVPAVSTRPALSDAIACNSGMTTRSIVWGAPNNAVVSTRSVRGVPGWYEPIGSIRIAKRATVSGSTMSVGCAGVKARVMVVCCALGTLGSTGTRRSHPAMASGAITTAASEARRRASPPARSRDAGSVGNGLLDVNSKRLRPVAPDLTLEFRMRPAEVKRECKSRHSRTTREIHGQRPSRNR